MININKPNNPIPPRRGEAFIFLPPALSILRGHSWEPGHRQTGQSGLGGAAVGGAGGGLEQPAWDRAPRVTALGGG